MASSADSVDAELPSVFERLLRNRDLSLFLPFLLGFASSRNSETPNTDHGTPISNPNRDRIILINPFTQGMVVVDGTDTLDSLLREFATKNGQPPASKASIDAMPSVEIGDDSGECSICLDEWETGLVVKEMPCKHKFHVACIEKWLRIHGSCPVCRYKMPVDNEESGDRSGQEEGGEEGRERSSRRTEREIWVSFSFSRETRNQSTSQTPSSDSNDTDTSNPVLDHQSEG